MTFKKTDRAAGLARGLAALAQLPSSARSTRRLRSTAAPAAAAPAAAACRAGVSIINKGDNAWMMTSTVLVLLMTIPGLGLFYGGMVRQKNVLSVLTHVFYTVVPRHHDLGASTATASPSPAAPPSSAASTSCS